jgi:hypothetical protein
MDYRDSTGGIIERESSRRGVARTYEYRCDGYASGIERRHRRARVRGALLYADRARRSAGAWVADGSLHYVNGVLTEGLIYPRNSKADRITEWARDASVALTENTDQGDGTRRFRFGRAEARRLEEHFGRLSTQRTLPVWLLADAQKLAEPFLAGYLHGDGCRTRRPGRVEHWSFSVSSRRLAVGLRLLAQSAGWHAFLSNRAWLAPSVVKGRVCAPTTETWTVVLYESKPSVGTRLWDHEGYVVGRIRRLTDHRQVRRVYDLTVAEDESFCVDGIFTHNSNHGWALAVDVANASGARLAWLEANALSFGWSWELVPEEPWHIRYYTGDAIPAAVLAYEQSPKETTVQVLVRYKGDARVWLSDRMYRREVPPAELVDDPTNATVLAAVIAGTTAATGPVVDISGLAGGPLANGNKVYQSGGAIGETTENAWGIDIATLQGGGGAAGPSLDQIEGVVRDAVADLGEGGSAAVRADA